MELIQRPAHPHPGGVFGASQGEPDGPEITLFEEAEQDGGAILVPE